MQKGKTVKKNLQIALVSIAVVFIMIAAFPAGQRAYIEYREHFTFRRLKSFPNDNGIPRLYINTDTGKMVASKEYWVGASYKLYDGEKVVSDGKTKIKGRGNTTWERPKKSYSLKLEKAAPLLGMSCDKRWILLNPYNDKSLLRNDFALSLGTIYDNLAYTPQFRQIEVVMNGKFLGVYQLTEKIKLSPERLSLPAGGYIVEKDRKRNPDSFLTEKDELAFVVSDADDAFYNKDYSPIRRQVQELEDAIYTEDFSVWSKLLDAQSAADWYIINEVTKNHDAKMQMSVYLFYNPEDCKFHFGPIWDFDIASGNINYDGCEKTDGFWIADAPWISKMMKSQEFRTIIKNRWNETKMILLEQINTYIPARAEYLNQAQEWNFKAWKLLDVKTWPQPFLPGSYEGEVKYLIDWQNERWKWMDSALQEL